MLTHLDGFEQKAATNIIVPQRDYLLVKPRQAQRTVSGIEIVKGQMRKGEETVSLFFSEVVAAGQDYINGNGILVEMRYKPGDIVVHHPGAVSPIAVAGKDYGLVNSNAVLAVVENFSEVIDVLGGEND